MTALHGLYAITPQQLQGTDLLQQVEAVLQGGASLVQYRDKSREGQRRLDDAGALADLCEQHQAILIINDDVELCLQSGAHGVHLGRDDTDLGRARTRLGKERIIGVSCYNDLKLACQAEATGADYVAFGAIYPSSTKPSAVQADLGLLKQAKTRLTLPTVAIGGITPENAAPVIEAGADMIAMIQGLFGRKDLYRTARTISQLFEKSRGNP